MKMIFGFVLMEDHRVSTAAFTRYFAVTGSIRPFASRSSALFSTLGSFSLVILADNENHKMKLVKGPPAPGAQGRLLWSL